MSTTSRYCKAYTAAQLRNYANWRENTTSLRKGLREVDGTEVEFDRTSIDPGDPLYVHDNFVVTDGIFNDENVVFNDISEGWKSFCANELHFEVPKELKEA